MRLRRKCRRYLPGPRKPMNSSNCRFLFNGAGFSPFFHARGCNKIKFLTLWMRFSKTGPNFLDHKLEKLSTTLFLKRPWLLQYVDKIILVDGLWRDLSVFSPIRLNTRYFSLILLSVLFRINPPIGDGFIIACKQGHARAVESARDFDTYWICNRKKHDG